MSIPERFGRGAPVFSFEFFLPKTADDLEAFKGTVRALKALAPSFVTLTYGAGGSARERTLDVAGMMHNELGVETAAHLTCITHTRAEIEENLRRIRGHGIRTIVALRGDAPKDGSALPPARRDFKYAADLVAFIRRSSGAAGGGGAFSVAVAGYPEGHPECPSREAGLAHLKAKVEAGADWVITQLFFDNRHYFDFVERARAAGIGVPIVPGLMPVTSFSQLQRFTSMCGASLPPRLTAGLAPLQEDREAVVRYGIDWAFRQSRELLDRGAPGLHFYTLNRSHSTEAVLRRLRGLD